MTASELIATLRDVKETTRRGFAALDEATQRAIASRGGRKAHADGVAHEFDSDEARKAGRKGGRVVSKDRAYMREIGRRGGLARRNGDKASATKPDRKE